MFAMKVLCGTQCALFHYMRQRPGALTQMMVANDNMHPLSLLDDIDAPFIRGALYHIGPAPPLPEGQRPNI